MIKRILLDLDGTSNCMIMHALEYVGCPVSRYFDDQYPLPGDYDMVKAAGMLLGCQVTPTQFWSSIPRSLWAETPPSQEFPWLLRNACRLVGEQNVFICTQPRVQEPDSAAGKLEWIHRFAPQFVDRCMIGACKYLLANDTTLLIDDSDQQVEQFIAAGGQAILMPRPWNSLYKKVPLAHLSEEFAKFDSSPTPLQTKFSHLRLIPSPV